MLSLILISEMSIIILYYFVIVTRCRNLPEYMKLAEKVKEFFHNEGIHSTTIQPEFVEVEVYCKILLLIFLFSVAIFWFYTIPNCR